MTTRMYCFLDTDILIHFETFDDVDWPKVLEVDEVYLVLASTVMAELNKHKDSHPIERIQKRARMLNDKLQDLLEEIKPIQPAKIEKRENVYILTYPLEPKVDWAALELDPNTSDDRLIAAMLQFSQKYPSETITLISNDFNARQKAKYQGLDAKSPKGKIAQFDLASLGAAKERQQPQVTFPNLVFGFWENRSVTGSVTRLFDSLKSGADTDEQIARIVGAERILLEATKVRAIQRGVSQEELEAFVKDYTEYIEKLEPALKLERSKKFGLFLQLDFIVQNTGSVLASEVEVIVQFPAESFVIEAADVENEIFNVVEIPDAPKPRWERSLYEVLHQSSLLLPTLSHSGPKRGWYYSHNMYNRNVIYYNQPSIYPKKKLITPPLCCYLPPTIKEGFQINYSIEAVNLPEPIEGKLNVILKEGKSDVSN